jgi:hypothetical protein
MTLLRIFLDFIAASHIPGEDTTEVSNPKPATCMNKTNAKKNMFLLATGQGTEWSN